MEITIKLYTVVAHLSLYGFCQVLVCANWLPLCGRYVVLYALTSVVCVGTIDTCGCLRTTVLSLVEICNLKVAK